MLGPIKKMFEQKLLVCIKGSIIIANYFSVNRLVGLFQGQLHFFKSNHVLFDTLIEPSPHSV